MLEIDEQSLRRRLEHRLARPDRHEHVVNNELVSPQDAAPLLLSLQAVLLSRPATIRVDAQGSVHDVLRRIRRLIDDWR